jgi:hypothetical protein
VTSSTPGTETEDDNSQQEEEKALFLFFVFVSGIVVRALRFSRGL